MEVWESGVLERAWEFCTPFSILTHASLSSGFSWIASFYNKALISWVKCFSEFWDPLQKINQNQVEGVMGTFDQ